MFTSLIGDNNWVDRVILPGGGRKYSGVHSKGLVWLKNENGSFPNHFLRRDSNIIVLYAHGNGGSLGDFKNAILFYGENLNVSFFAVEYPGYGCAEGVPSEGSVNDNVRTAFDFLISIGYPHQNIILMGYSIGTGPIIQLTSQLCDGPNPTPPGGVISLAGYLSIVDVIRDIKGSLIISLISNAISNRWNSGECIKKVTCPSLFIHGKKDEVIPYEHSEKLYKNCISNKKVIKLCPEANHSNFDEPSDTIDSIITFFHEHVKIRYKEKTSVINIPQPFFVVPNSIKRREEGKECQFKYEMETDAGDSDSRTETWDTDQGFNCDPNTFKDFTDFVQWIFKDFTDVFKSVKNKELTNDVDDGSLSFESSADVNILKLKDSHVVRKLVLPTSPLSDLKGARSQSNKKLFNENEINQSKKDNIDITQDQASLLIIEKYVAALNNQDILRVVSHLHSDVLIRYPDSNRNWSSSLRAYEKYNILFSKMPSLKVHYEVIEVTNELKVTTALCTFQFSCEISRIHTVKSLAFVIRSNKILLIEYQD